MRWAALVVVLSGSPAQTLLFAALGPILPMIAARFGAGGDGAFISQMVMTMPALGIILGGLVSGLVIERCGVRRVLYASLSAYAVLGSAGMYLDNSMSLLASRFLLGIAVAHQSPCVVMLLAERFDETARARLLGYQGAVSGIASFTALVSAGVLAEWAGWRAPFAIYLLALPVLVCAVLVERASPVPRAAPITGTGRGSILPLWKIYAVVIPLYVAVLMTSIQLSFLLAADGVTSAFSRSWVIAMGSAGSTCSGGAFGYLLSRLGARRTWVALACGMGFGFLVIGVATSTVSIAAGCLLSGVGAGLTTPYFTGVILSRSTVETRGRALGFMYTSVYLADFLNPVLIAPLRIAIGIHGAFMAVGGVLIATAIGMAIYRRRAPTGLATVSAPR